MKAKKGGHQQMQDERKRILQLVENGTISAVEAIGLLEQLEKGQGSSSAQVEEKETATLQKKTTEQVEKQQTSDEAKDTEFFDEDLMKKNSADQDEFIDDLKNDLSQLSTRIMDFLGGAVTRVKDMDFSSMSPTGKKQEWTVPLGATSFDNISIDMPNGHLTIRDSADGSAYLEVSATPMLQFGSTKELSSDEIEKQFNAKVDAGTLRVSNTAKSLKTDVIAYVPKGDYKKVRVHLFNGGFKMHSLNVDQLRVETKNGSLHLSDVNFDSAELESANGDIKVQDVSGRDIEAETLNGRVYVDGVIQSVEGKSVNGNIILTTTSQQAERVKARTTAGTIELYVPDSVSLIGEVSSALGKMDVNLSDVELLDETNQVFNKSLRFRKDLSDAQQLSIDAETKTGSVIVRYTL